MDDYIRQQIKEAMNILLELNGYIDGRESELKSRFKLIKPNLDNRIDCKTSLGGDDDLQLRYGQGSIRKRERKTKKGEIYRYWEASCMVNGERHYITAKTQAECLARLKDITEVKKDNKNSRLSLKVKDWMEKWYRDYKKPYLATSSLKSISCCIRKYINPKIGDKPLRGLKTDDIQKCLNSIKYPRQKEVSKNTINEALNQAAAEGLIKNNPCSAVKFTKKPSEPSEALTAAEQIKLLDSLTGTELYNIVMCYLWTGCRRNELLDLKAEDINFDNNTIHIRGTKSKRSDRYIPIFIPIRALLLDISPGTGKLFSIPQDRLNRAFRKACDQIGLYKTVIHTLRHTFATNAFERGVDIKTVQSWLGHSKYQTTADIYTHLSGSHVNEQIMKMQ